MNVPIKKKKLVYIRPVNFIYKYVLYVYSAVAKWLLTEDEVDGKYEARKARQMVPL